MDLAENNPTEVTEERKIKNGSAYNHLFPKSKLEVTIIKRNAKLEDTVKFLPKAINSTLKQTQYIIKRLINELPVYSHYAICKRVWDWVYTYIKYRKDDPNKEQIQSPQYTWAVKAGDCDDFTVLIVSMLRHIKALKVILRVSMYDEDNGYQHIYPVVVLPDGKKIIMDCVAKKFNYEAPYIQKIDKPMELQFLNGIPVSRSVNKSIDAEDLLQGEDVGDLGKKGKAKEKIKAKVQNVAKKAKGAVQKAKVATKKVAQKAKVVTKKVAQKVKDSKVIKAVKKGVHAVNKVNPVTALLRAGILLAMKTNVLKLAENLRYAYLTQEQAQQKGIDISKWQRLVGVNNRLAKIFHGAGGEHANYKKAILTGKGNSNKEVMLSGFGAIDNSNYNDSHSLQQILGLETYNSEIGEVEGLGSLGVVPATALASAMTALTAIAAALKSILPLRKNKSKKEEEKTDEGKNETERQTETETASDSNNNSDGSEKQPETRRPAKERSESSSADNNENSDNATESNTQQKDGGGGGANESSNTEIPAETNDTDMGSGTTTNSTDSGSKTDSTGTPSTDSTNTSDKEDENEKPATNAKGVTTTETKALTGFAQLTDWIKKNPLPAAGIGIVVISGIAYGLYLVFKPKEKSKALSGLPKRKHHAPYTSTKVKVHRLK